jgi:hypothetical protein
VGHHAATSGKIFLQIFHQRPRPTDWVAWRPPAPRYPRGYGAMYSACIGQADEGCDFDFLLAGEAIAEPEIH